MKTKSITLSLNPLTAIVMKTKSITLFIILLLVLVALGCNDKQDKAPEKVSSEQMLVGSWVYNDDNVSGFDTMTFDVEKMKKDGIIFMPYYKLSIVKKQNTYFAWMKNLNSLSKDYTVEIQNSTLSFNQIDSSRGSYDSFAFKIVSISKDYFVLEGDALCLIRKEACLDESRKHTFHKGVMRSEFKRINY
jgi:hypothetical protein